MYVMQPFATACDGCDRFFQNLCATSCVKFGFVGFSLAPATTSNYKCAYLGTLGTGPTSLAVTAPLNTYKPYPVIGSYVYQPLAGCNPCFWVTEPMCSPTTNANILPSGPSGSPTGEAYHATLNTTGPSRSTWLQVDGGNPPSNTNTLWAFNYGGFQIPRYPLNTALTQGQSYYSVAGDDWGGYSWSNGGSAANYGCNGLWHARPLFETDGLEAMQYALYNLTNISSLSTLSNGSTAGVTLPSENGCKKVIVFFTDGIPTDDSTPYSLYSSNVVAPAKTNGVAIYAIGLSLNASIKTAQANFLQTLANYGACGSQEFQVTSSSSLTSTFTDMARSCAQSQR